MSNLLRRPTQKNSIDQAGEFERYNLTENPFPSAPIVNSKSEDKRINGDIFETAIRQKEYDQVEKNFLKQSHSDPNHLRLGYIMELGYVGRGNGKSAFLVNLQRKINQDYCLDISNEVNKCFAVYILPKPQGQDKSFSSFAELIFQAIIESNIINVCLATLRLESIKELYPEFNLDESNDNKLIISNLNSEEWFQEQNIGLRNVMENACKSSYLQQLPPDFPLFNGRNQLLSTIVTQNDFVNYYNENLAKKPKERLEYIFSHLVNVFQAAGFNGAYVLVDDFERIIEFQTAQKQIDFAVQLRSCVFDGVYASAKFGFYNFLIVLHAGVQRMMGTSWTKSGMDHRAPIAPSGVSKHIIEFEKLSHGHAILLIKKYLAEYRVKPSNNDALFPFDQAAVRKIAELSENNAAKILAMAYRLLDKAADMGQMKIDEEFVDSNRGGQEKNPDKNPSTLESADSVDLMKEAQE